MNRNQPWIVFDNFGNVESKLLTNMYFVEQLEDALAMTSMICRESNGFVLNNSMQSEHVRTENRCYEDHKCFPKDLNSNSWTVVT